MPSLTSQDKIIDLFVIGGGVNGCGIARDAAGRGLSVALAEMNDLASATSSASTKLFHGGLRYLEYYKFRLVREALKEREVLLSAMPHISWPLRFVLPVDSSQRPAWFIRLGLFVYDHLGGRKILPGTKTLDLQHDSAGVPLNAEFTKAFEYSDCWVQDSRLVVLNARDAQKLGAEIKVRTKVISAQRINDQKHGNLWCIKIKPQHGGEQIVYARALVNAGGSWVGDIITDIANIKSTENVRLVRGSHIVVRKLFDHDRPYILQGKDGRFAFAIPYEEDFTLIGTTDLDHLNGLDNIVCTEKEADYLRHFMLEYFDKAIKKEDVVWSYSGVRPLYDDGAKSATDATRDYFLSLNQDNGAPLLNIFGGKITTYRRLAEAAFDKLSTYFPQASGRWTAGVALPGGDFPVDGVEQLIVKAQCDYPFLSSKCIKRMIRCYGTELWDILSDAKSLPDLGQDFGAGLSEAEVVWLINNEFARDATDILWRRTKIGLVMNGVQVVKLQNWLKVWFNHHSENGAAA